MTRTRVLCTATALAASVLLALTGCTTAADNAKQQADPTAAKLAGSTEFNDAKLAELAGKIKQALQGKDLHAVRVAMVINSPSAYWTEGRTGMTNAAKELGVQAEFQAPSSGDLSTQLSILDTLRSDKVDGYTVSAVDPVAVRGPVDAAQRAGIGVVAIDSPLSGTSEPITYLGTPNTDAGEQAGQAMKTLLGGSGKVAVLTGSLTAANATQRIAGFKKAIEGSGVRIVDTLNDDSDPSKALSNAQMALQANPDLAGIYTVWSYDGPAAGQAVKAAGKSGTVKVVADDAEPKTVDFVRDGVVQAMVLQRPYQQGYLGVYLLTALKVLGKQATDQLLKPYLTQKDGTSTLSSGIGLVTGGNLQTYLDDLKKLGVTP
ncbi:MAG: Monosaccharide transporter substrate-binding protein family [Amycolatopsis sp.]|jgi:ribose transport system substrate-binding protein|uniref:substrate-binding domain-containing protein n=1 Tax=Amycolatopsis sp. TaxID=37632 RepID=UPI0026258EF8|nr:substrate-binding domain-containing protein [Amycolatopsis sp.]MCU1685147.1 Monosaccharide transporter substrate-binding protein family [Amycolatopsis sp.]